MKLLFLNGLGADDRLRKQSIHSFERFLWTFKKPQSQQDERKDRKDDRNLNLRSPAITGSGAHGPGGVKEKDQKRPIENDPAPAAAIRNCDADGQK